MDSAEITHLTNMCTNISDNIRTLFPSLQLNFLIYHPDKKQDAISSKLSKLNGHPAFNEAYQILKAWAHAPSTTSFLGLSEGQESVAFSFKTRPKTIGFIAVNIALYKELYHAIEAIHFEMAIFLDTYSSHLRKPLSINGNVFVHKTSEIATSKLKLKADIYTVLQLLREGQYDAPFQLARKRSMEVITPQSNQKPEEYAFPIALDVINYTVEKQISSTISTRNPSPLLSQYQLAEQIGECFDNDNLQSWIQFASACQTMAWSGFAPSQILGAAIHTSTNPITKAIGHLLAELTNLAPVEESHLPAGYNPFLAEEVNHIRHERSSEETFEMIMYHVMEADSHLPLTRVANNQNEALLKGKISGWCAYALHASAKAYLGAKDRGIPPIQAARLEFQSANQTQNWKILKTIAQHVIDMQRAGTPIDLNGLMKWIAELPDSRHLSESLAATMNDPHYNKSSYTAPEPQTSFSNVPLKKVNPDTFLDKLGSNKPLVQPVAQEAPPPQPAGFTFDDE